jgi:DNA-binding response OmpR family regulator
VPSKHVLVVEDDDPVKQAVRDALSDAGYTVWTASTGAQALEIMHKQSPDVLLLDLMMPDMTGWELLRRMPQSEELTAVPVLVVSAAGANGLRDAQDLGAPVFVRKPFDLDKLLIEVERLTTRPTRQCAWCGHVATSTGDFALHSGRSLPWATHGICPQCLHRQTEPILGESA